MLLCHICCKPATLAPDYGGVTFQKMMERLTSIVFENEGAGKDYGICNPCGTHFETILALQNTFMETRRKLCSLTTYICHTILQKSGSGSDSPENCLDMRGFQKWNLDRLEKYLLWNLDSESESFLQEGRILFETPVTTKKRKAKEEIKVKAKTVKRKKIEQQENDDEKKKKSTTASQKANRTFNCPFCDKVFRSQRSLEIHAQTHDGAVKSLQCQKCAKSFDTPSLLFLHSKIHLGKFVCKYDGCRKGFHSLQRLQKHEHLLHESEPDVSMFDCNFCFKIFETHWEKQTHEAEHVARLESHLCEDCGKSFSTKSILFHHRKRNHDLQQCQECHKWFRCVSSLKIHSLTHAPQENKPYKCTHADCDYSSIQASSLRQHMAKHTGILPYKCDYCDSAYSYKKGVRRHMSEEHYGLYLKDKKFLCEICFKIFADKKELDDHSSDHNKHKCKLCDLQFDNVTSLNEHLLRHADVKPYSCNFCPDSFVRRTELIIHVKKSHPNEDIKSVVGSKSKQIVVEFEGEEESDNN